MGRHCQCKCQGGGVTLGLGCEGVVLSMCFGEEGGGVSCRCVLGRGCPVDVFWGGGGVESLCLTLRAPCPGPLASVRPPG